MGMQSDDKHTIKRWIWALVGLCLGAGIGVGVLAMVLAGCDLTRAAPDGCAPEALRCAGTRLEVCDADRRWGLVADCATVTPGVWACCPAQEACVPAAECGGDAGDPFADAGKMVDAGDAGDTVP
jgi:hypothetical protein